MPALEHARAGARRYATLLRLPGARGPVIASAVGSMPIGMFGLAILLLAQDATGSFAVAGRVVGAFGIGNALGAVAQGRLMDRLGQTRVLRVRDGLDRLRGLRDHCPGTGGGDRGAVLAGGRRRRGRDRRPLPRTARRARWPAA